MNGLIKNLIESFLHQHTSIMACPHQGVVSFQQPLMARILPIWTHSCQCCDPHVLRLCGSIVWFHYLTVTDVTLIYPLLLLCVLWLHNLGEAVSRCWLRCWVCGLGAACSLLTLRTCFEGLRGGVRVGSSPTWTGPCLPSLLWARLTN